MKKGKLKVVIGITPVIKAVTFTRKDYATGWKMYHFNEAIMPKKYVELIINPNALDYGIEDFYKYCCNEIYSEDNKHIVHKIIKDVKEKFYKGNTYGFQIGDENIELRIDVTTCKNEKSKN